jgi:outer membrane protein TolC
MRAEFSGGVIRTYGDYVAAAAKLETLVELRDSAVVEATTLAMRRDAGDATERDAQLAELERARIAVQVEEARAALSAARNELGRLTGQRVAAPNRAVLFPQLVGVRASANDVANSPIVRTAEAEAQYFAQQDIRLERERIPPMSVILQAGRGDFGETRLGAGLAWTIPAFRKNQGERAHAQAEVVRARAAAATFRQSIGLRLDAIAEEAQLLHAAFDRIDQEAIPAAVLATNSATRMQQAGKTDLLSVVVARRDLSTLKLRRLELATRAWTLLGDWVSLTGAVPKIH